MLVKTNNQLFVGSKCAHHSILNLHSLKARQANLQTRKKYGARVKKEQAKKK